MVLCRGRGLPLLALLTLGWFVLLLNASSFAAGQAPQIPDVAEHDDGNHLGDENDLLKGIIGDHGEDEMAGLDDDMPHMDDFDEEDDEQGVDMHNFDSEDDAGGMSPDEEKEWRLEEEQYFKKADADGDGYLNEHEYKRSLMQDMNSHSDPADETEGDEPKPNPSTALAGSGPLDEDAMTEDEKMHYNELGDQFREEDKDKDGKISLEEWLSMIFHDEPQEPEFEDGIENMYDTRMNHHELSEEEQAEMLEDAKNEFNSTDLNKDGKLTREEVCRFSSLTNPHLSTFFAHVAALQSDSSKCNSISESLPSLIPPACFDPMLQSDPSSLEHITMQTDSSPRTTTDFQFRQGPNQCGRGRRRYDVRGRGAATDSLYLLTSFAPDSLVAFSLPAS